MATRRTSTQAKEDASDKVDAYLARIPEPARSALGRLRKQIHAAAPGAAEVISYGMPTFRHHTMLVGFRAAAKHCSFFVWSSTVLKPFAKELADFETSAGGIRFTADKPIPAALVKKIVKVRLAENEARAAAKSARKRSASRKKKP